MQINGARCPHRRGPHPVPNAPQDTQWPDTRRRRGPTVQGLRPCTNRAAAPQLLHGQWRSFLGHAPRLVRPACPLAVTSASGAPAYQLGPPRVRNLPSASVRCRHVFGQGTPACSFLLVESVQWPCVRARGRRGSPPTLATPPVCPALARAVSARHWTCSCRASVLRQQRAAGRRLAKRGTCLAYLAGGP